MLTIRQNLLETINGGKPDRFVKGYEFYKMVWGNPIADANPMMPMPGGEVVDSWGITTRWPVGFPGPFPVHDEEHIALKDVTKWEKTLTYPRVDFPAEEWAKYDEEVNQIDRNEYFFAAMSFPGIFEQLHYLMGMTQTLMNFYEEPEAMHDLIDYIVEYNVRRAEEIAKYQKPDMLFQSDDWGSSNNSFMSVDMFEEFIVPAYLKLNKTWRDNGVELIVHHSDSYAANLVPSMIDMGIDIWQGVLSTNDPEYLVKTYGGKISFMGGVDNSEIDVEDWSAGAIEEKVRSTCQACGKLYFIPCMTQGGEPAVYPGVAETVREKIDLVSSEMF